MTTTIDLAFSLGTNGFSIYREKNTDLSGYSVSAVGDVNGDSYYDIIIGVPSQVIRSAGISYVLYGSVVIPGTIGSISTQGFVIYGNTYFGQSGYSVSEAEDVNNDGYR